MKKNRLGKGIGALIKDKINDNSLLNTITNIMIDDISLNPFQPRLEFDKNKINELASSIKEKGLITPVSVRSFNDSYQLIAGERRLRASQVAGLKEIPAYVMHVKNDSDMMELALIENIQRENLDIFEEAQAYIMMIEKYNYSHEQIGKIVGKSRANISNILRLLKLPEEIIDSLRKNEISIGHARALVGIKNPKKIKEIWMRIIEREESVRSTEEIVFYINNQKNLIKKSKILNKVLSTDKNHKVLEDELIDLMGTKVVISKKNKGGKIEVSFFSKDDLNRLIEIFRRLDNE